MRKPPGGHQKSISAVPDTRRPEGTGRDEGGGGSLVTGLLPRVAVSTARRLPTGRWSGQHRVWSAESLVMTGWMDSASQETYELYRIRGKFDNVIANIKKINHFKQLYCTKVPLLRWQFVVFGHNEHELPAARRVAEELGMEFS